MMTEPLCWSGSSHFPSQLALTTQGEARPRLWDYGLTRLYIPQLINATV